MSRSASDSSVFQAIADPTRREILLMLAGSDLTVTEMIDGLNCGLTQSAVSQHLAVLRRAGLTVATKSGREQVYSIQAKPLKEVSDWISVFDAFWGQKLKSLGSYLDEQAAGKKGKK